MTRPSRRFTAFFIAIAVYLTLSAILGVLLGEAALRPPRRPQLESVTLTTRDRVELRAWLFSPSPSTSNGHSVLMLHGVADNRESSVSMALRLADRGYRVLTPDARGSAAARMRRVLAFFAAHERDRHMSSRNSGRRPSI